MIVDNHCITLEKENVLNSPIDTEMKKKNYKLCFSHTQLSTQNI